MNQGLTCSVALAPVRCPAYSAVLRLVQDRAAYNLLLVCCLWPVARKLNQNSVTWMFGPRFRKGCYVGGGRGDD